MSNAPKKVPQKEKAPTERFLRALFHGKLAKSRVPVSKGYRMPEGK